MLIAKKKRTPPWHTINSANREPLFSCIHINTALYSSSILLTSSEDITKLWALCRVHWKSPNNVKTADWERGLYNCWKWTKMIYKMSGKWQVEGNRAGRNFEEHCWSLFRNFCGSYHTGLIWFTCLHQQRNEMSREEHRQGNSNR